MITITTLIINEMNTCLGHKPTNEEMNSLSAFLATREIKWLVDLDKAIQDWKNACTKECAWCGYRYLPEEMESHKDSGEYFCCGQCEKDYKQEHGVAECVMD